MTGRAARTTRELENFTFSLPLFSFPRSNERAIQNCTMLAFYFCKWFAHNGCPGKNAVLGAKMVQKQCNFAAHLERAQSEAGVIPTRVLPMATPTFYCPAESFTG
jgi:hypothetical protein